MYPPNPPKSFSLSGCRACEVILAKHNSAGLALGGGGIFLGSAEQALRSAEQCRAGAVGRAEQALRSAEQAL